MKLFDIGANNGAWIEANRYRASKIIAVEADANLAEGLREKWADNPGVVVVSAAASHSCEPVTFYHANMDTVSTASEDWVKNSRFSGGAFFKWDTGSIIRGVTLDRLIEEFGSPDLIKIDVEGYEDRVLQGLTQKVPMLCFEFSEEIETIQQSIDHLKKIGFTQFAYCEMDDYTWEPYAWKVWEELDLMGRINPQRKELWGMIWAK